MSSNLRKRKFRNVARLLGVLASAPVGLQLAANSTVSAVYGDPAAADVSNNWDNQRDKIRETMKDGDHLASCLGHGRISFFASGDPKKDSMYVKVLAASDDLDTKSSNFALGKNVLLSRRVDTTVSSILDDALAGKLTIVDTHGILTKNWGKVLKGLGISTSVTDMPDGEIGTVEQFKTIFGQEIANLNLELCNQENGKEAFLIISKTGVYPISNIDASAIACFWALGDNNHFASQTEIQNMTDAEIRTKLQQPLVKRLKITDNQPVENAATQINELYAAPLCPYIKTNSASDAWYLNPQPVSVTAIGSLGRVNGLGAKEWCADAAVGGDNIKNTPTTYGKYAAQFRVSKEAGPLDDKAQMTLVKANAAEVATALKQLTEKPDWNGDATQQKAVSDALDNLQLLQDRITAKLTDGITDYGLSWVKTPAGLGGDTPESYATCLANIIKGTQAATPDAAKNIELNKKALADDAILKAVTAEAAANAYHKAQLDGDFATITALKADKAALQTRLQKALKDTVTLDAHGGKKFDINTIVDNGDKTDMQKIVEAIQAESNKAWTDKGYSFAQTKADVETAAKNAGKTEGEQAGIKQEKENHLLGSKGAEIGLDLGIAAGCLGLGALAGKLLFGGKTAGVGMKDTMLKNANTKGTAKTDTKGKIANTPTASNKNTIKA